MKTDDIIRVRCWERLVGDRPPGGIAMVQLETPSKTKPFVALETDHGEATDKRDAEIRWDKVAAIRKAIMDGTYETPEKIDAALRALLERLRSETRV